MYHCFMAALVLSDRFISSIHFTVSQFSSFVRETCGGHVYHCFTVKLVWFYERDMWCGCVSLLDCALVLPGRLMMSMWIIDSQLLWFYQGDLWWACDSLIHSCTVFTMETCDEQLQHYGWTHCDMVCGLCGLHFSRVSNLHKILLS